MALTSHETKSAQRLLNEAPAESKGHGGAGGNDSDELDMPRRIMGLLAWAMG